MLRKKIAAFRRDTHTRFFPRSLRKRRKSLRKKDVSKGPDEDSFLPAHHAQSAVERRREVVLLHRGQDLRQDERGKPEGHADGKEKTMVRQGKEKQFQKDKEALSSAARECATKFRKELMQGK